MDKKKDQITYIDIERQLRRPMQNRKGISILSGYGLTVASKIREEIIEKIINPTGLEVPFRKKIPTQLAVQVLGIDIDYVHKMANLERSMSKGDERQDFCVGIKKKTKKQIALEVIENAFNSHQKELNKKSPYYAQGVSWGMLWGSIMMAREMDLISLDEKFKLQDRLNKMEAIGEHK